MVLGLGIQKLKPERDTETYATKTLPYRSLYTRVAHTDPGGHIIRDRTLWLCYDVTKTLLRLFAQL